MSELYNLIKDLCPDGVEYKKIGDIAVISRGIRVVKEQLKSHGEIPVYQNSLKPLGYHEKANCPADTVFIIGAGTAGAVGYSKVAFWSADDCYYFKCPENLDSRYLYFAMIKNKSAILSKVRKASIPRLSRSDIEKILIPVPPIEVQREIVRILDNFTDYMNCLEKELNLRKKQYSYYRDKLLTFGDDVEYKTLGEVFDIRNGYTPSKSKAEYWKNGTVPWFRIDDIRENGRILSDAIKHITIDGVKRSGTFPANSLIMSTTATIGEHALIRTEFVCNQQITCFSLKDEFNSHIDIKYVFYIFFKFGEWCKNNVNKGGGLPIINSSKLMIYKIPIPPIEEQERIVKILDRFDSLCNDLTSGIPAEISARKKQYEYYRDRLLQFEIKNTEVK